MGVELTQVGRRAPEDGIDRQEVRERRLGKKFPGIAEGQWFHLQLPRAASEKGRFVAQDFRFHHPDARSQEDEKDP